MDILIKIVRRVSIFAVFGLSLGCLTLFSQNNERIAVLFIHGLGGNHTSWDEVRKDLIATGNSFIGNYSTNNSQQFRIDNRFSSISKNKQSTAALLLFTLDFSNNQNLNFVQQGVEVKQVVDLINHDYQPSGIILVGHSMGGLAARRYLMDYGTDGILGLITISTPHLGSFLGYAKDILNINCSASLESRSKEYERIILFLADGNIDICSQAVRCLRPNSPEMLEMYKQNYPKDLPTASIISRQSHPGVTSDLLNHLSDEAYKDYGRWCSPAPLDFYSIQLNTLNDGIVSVPSQDLKLGIVNGNEIDPGYFYTDRFHTKSEKDIETFNKALQYILDRVKSGNNADTGNVRIGFILDSSGSMSDSDPKDIRKYSVIQLLNWIDAKDYLFIVDFDSEGRWINSDNYVNWNEQKLIQSILTIDANGGTDIGAGLTAMKQAMISQGTSSRRSAVILFTDGKGGYNDEARWFSENHIPIYTVSYKDLADGNLLSKIANETGGVYRQVNDELDVILAFSQFISECMQNSWICTYQSEIKQSQKISFAFYVDNDRKSFRSCSSWSGSKIDFILKDPNGKIYSQQNSPGWTVGRNYLNATIENPVKGQWTVTFTGVEIPATGEKFIFNTFSDTPDEYSLSKGTYTGNLLNFTFGGTVTTPTGTSVTPKLLMLTPRGKTIDISSSYKDGAITYIPVDGPGDYTLKSDFELVDKSGATIQRHYERTVRTGTSEISTVSLISTVTGNYLRVPLGKNIGNHAGIRCYIYPANSPDANPVAIGIVTFVTETECNIEIQNFTGQSLSVVPGDIVKLDTFQWQNDRKP